MSNDVTLGTAESNPDFLIRFARNLRTICKIKGIEKNALAEQSGVSVRTLTYMQMGLGSVNEKEREAIARTVGVEVGHLTAEVPDGELISYFTHVIEQVTVQDGEYPSWYIHGGSGRIPLKLLAPDPDQPREYMDPDELEALTESVRTKGVRQPLIATPLVKAPWVTVDRNNHPEAILAIVSGHRRNIAAKRAQLVDVPVEVRIYESRESYEQDASLLNANRSDLSPIEQGRELVKLMRHSTLEKVAQLMGRSVPWVIERIALTKLSPKIQATRLHPATRDQSAPPLRLKVAAKLGALEECTENELLTTAKKFGLTVTPSPKTSERVWQLQELYLSHIESEAMGATAATDLLVRSRKQSSAYGRMSQYRISEPRKMRERVRNLARLVEVSPTHNWSDTDLRDALTGATPEQIRSLAQDLENAAVKLFTLSKRLTTHTTKPQS